jgi:hypothetical protein
MQQHDEITMSNRAGRGTMSDLIAVVVVALLTPPAEATHVMALAVDPAGVGDRLGLIVAGQPTPGGLDLLASALSSRARPHASLLLEWSLALASPGMTSRRHYRGWHVEQAASEVRWRALSVVELQAVPDLRTRRPLGEEPLASFEA